MMTLNATDIDLTTPWKERDKIDKADVVRQLIEREGLTTGQAAEVLHTSRSAIIGIKDRANIHLPQTGVLAEIRHRMANHRRKTGQMATFDGRRAAGLQASPRKPKPAPAAKAHRAKRPPRIEGTKQYVPVPDKAWIALDGSTPKPLADHSHGECLWAIGDSHPMLFCCLPIDPGSAYCPTHRALGFRALPAKGTTE